MYTMIVAMREDVYKFIDLLLSAMFPSDRGEFDTEVLELNEVFRAH